MKPTPTAEEMASFTQEYIDAGCPGYPTAVHSIDAVIHGWERIGSVGDLRIQYLTALAREGRTRVWVVGCFDNQGRPQDRPGAESYQTELFALAWRLARSGVRSSAARAIASLRARCHRMLPSCRH